MPEDAASRGGGRDSSGTGASAFRARTACSAPVDASLIDAGQSRSASIRTIRAGQDDVLVAGPGTAPAARTSRSRSCCAPTDVLHDFTVPQFRVKMDLVPGMVTYLWLTPTRTGTYEILCEELCGLGAFRDARHGSWSTTAAAYQTWLASATDVRADCWRGRPAMRRGRPGAPIATVLRLPRRRRRKATSSLNAPKLAGQPGWYLDAAAAQLQARHPRRERRATRSASRWWAIAAPLDDDDDRQCRRLHRDAARTRDRRPRVRGDAGAGRGALHDLRRLPRRGRRRHLDDERAATGAHERLVPGAAAEEFQAGPSAARTRRTSTARRWLLDAA